MKIQKASREGGGRKYDGIRQLELFKTVAWRAQSCAGTRDRHFRAFPVHEIKLRTSGISCCSIDKDDLAELNLRELGRIIRTCEPRPSVKFDAAAAKVHEWPALTAWLRPGFFLRELAQSWSGMTTP